MSAMTSVEARPNRKNCFDLLRLFAASVVVIAHGQTDLGTDEVLWNSWSLFDGVGMFFVLSGMLVFSSGVSIFERTGSFVNYFRNRYLRIAPGIYAFALLLPLILVVTGLLGVAQLFSFDIVVWLGSAFFLLPNYHPGIWSDVGTGILNGPLYTIPAEISFYLAVPFLVLAARRWGFRIALVAMVILSVLGCVLMYVAPGPIPNIVHHTFLERGAYFTAGMAFAHYWPRMRQSWGLWAVAFAVYLAMKAYLPDGELMNAFQPLLLAIPLAYTLVFFGNRAAALGGLTKRVGDLSFGTYIWHAVVINLMIEWGWTGDRWAVAAALVIAWIVAAISWHLIEKPALSLKRVSLQRA
jgi:peptidoglycan/LPS O-acetylase OafA/YrhL